MVLAEMEIELTFSSRTVAAILRGWVTAIWEPSFVQPALYRNWGICAVRKLASNHTYEIKNPLTRFTTPSLADLELRSESQIFDYAQY